MQLTKETILGILEQVHMDVDEFTCDMGERDRALVEEVRKLTMPIEQLIYWLHREKDLKNG